jgi:hypothetical protein
VDDDAVDLDVGAALDEFVEGTPGAADGEFS